MRFLPSKQQKTEYKYVYLVTDTNLKQIYKIQITKLKYSKCFKMEEWDIKDLAKKVDILLIKAGKEPVNILKKKTNE